jgi:hypothetical protein
MGSLRASVPSFPSYMGLDPDSLNDRISRRGQLMFHVTRVDAVPAILAEGLRPGSERGVSSKGGFFKTRAGHVYLGDLLSLAIVEVAGPRAYLQVDLCKLDPALIDPDEDQVQGSFDRRAAGWVAEPPPALAEGTDPEKAGHALATWADTTEGFDAPKVTAKSLESGRISYRGTIPADAISVVTFLSEGPQLFHDAAQQALSDRDLGLAPPPELGFYTTEVARALALTRSLIRSAAESVGEPADPLLPEWPHSEDAIPTRDLLIRAARERARADELAQAEIMRAAKQVACAVPDLQPELGWSATRDACVTIAQVGVQVITCLREHDSEEAAAAAACAAMEAVAAVPDQH